MFLADFHIHSNFSDGNLSIPEIVDYFGSREFGAIAITDHLCESETWLGKASSYLGCTLTPATFPLYREILRTEAERAWDQYRMVLIPGVEFTKNTVSNHRSAHVLALGITEYISPNLEITELIHEIHKHGGLAVAAHPVWTQRLEKQTFHLWSRKEELASLFDAWEVASGTVIFDKVKSSGLPMLANSDFHRVPHMTSWKTALQCEKMTEPILRAIKKQELQFHFYREANQYERSVDLRSHLGIGYRSYGLGNALRAYKEVYTAP